MRLATLLLSLFVVTCSLYEVTCITNGEFFELIKPYAEDLESFDLDDPFIDNEDDDGSDVIDLPGNADDELDIEYLLSKLDLADAMEHLQQPETTSNDQNLGWWRRRRRRRRRRWHNPCKCHRYACSCCLRHTFKVNVIFKRWRFRVNACVTVAYLPKDYGFSFTITYNRRRVFHKEISLRRPPALCYGVPGLARFVRACVEIYRVNLRRKSMCLRLAFIIDVKIKKFRFHLHLGCLRIPLLEGLEGAEAMKLLETLEASVENTDTGEVQDIALSELPNLYRQLQVEIAEKYSRGANENESETESWNSQDLFFEPEE